MKNEITNRNDFQVAFQGYLNAGNRNDFTGIVSHSMSTDQKLGPIILQEAGVIIISQIKGLVSKLMK